MQTIILSVRPPWARLLVTGRKTVELRKRKLPGDGPVRALIYETKGKGGRGMLIGEVSFPFSMQAGDWSVGMGLTIEQLAEMACVTEGELREYYEPHGLLDAHIWVRRACVEYDTPRQLKGRPPQSWRWL